MGFLGDTFLATLTAYLIQLPIFLVWLAAIVLSLVFWRRHPRVSLLTITALLILGIVRLIDTYLGMWLPVLLQRSGMAMTSIGAIAVVKNVLVVLVSALAWGVLVTALFGWRKAGASDQGG